MKRILFLLLLVTNLANAQFIGLRRVKPGGGGTETDPTVSSDVKSITSTNISNWTTAYGWGNHSGLYLPIVGGSFTGTSGAGFLGLPTQSSAPATPPASSVRLYSNSSGYFSWLFPNGFSTSFNSSGLTANRTYTLPNIDGEIILGSGTQTIGGSKSFTAQTSFGGSVVPSSSITYSLGTTSLFWANGYIGGIISPTNLILSNTSGSATIFRSAGSANEFARFTATNNNFVLQTLGTFGTDDNAALQLKTNKTASSAIARAMNLTSTLTAAANNDVLVGIDVAPTFTNGGFTGVANYAIRSAGLIVPAVTSTTDIGSTSLKWNNVYANNLRGNGTLRLSSATGNSIIFQQSSDANTTAMMFSTSGLWAFQPPGSLPTDDGVNIIQAAGSVKAVQFRLSASNTAPSSATDTGTAGEIRITSGFIYYCPSTNVWVRAALTTW